MPKRVSKSKKIEAFTEAIDLLVEQGLDRETVINALKESIESVVKGKTIEGLEPIDCEVTIIPEEYIIDIKTYKRVVEEVQDDAVEVELEDAQEIDKNAKIGDRIAFEENFDEFTKADTIKLKSVFNQKIREAEKAAIFAAYQDKVDEIVVGTVEKVETNTTLINFERTTVNLLNKDKIGNEMFKVGDTVKVYIEKVDTGSESSIKISRACPGFLKRLFEEEVRDIYDGVVKIEGIVREAGERAKIAVSTKSLDIDPVGSCIGVVGQKIQKICEQINHEKIDVIQYHEHKGLYVLECLKPATVLGVKMNEDGTAVAVVNDGDLKIAIGRKGVNARLAVRLSGVSIDIKEESQAKAEGIEYKTKEEMEQEEFNTNTEKQKARIIELAKDEVIAEKKKEIEKANQVNEVEEDEEVFEEEFVNDDQNDKDLDVEVNKNSVDEKPVESKKEEIPFEEQKVEFNPVIMQSKVSLDDLEKQIDKERKKNTTQQVKVKKDKKEEKVEKKEIKGMSIYTDDELEQLDQDEELEEYEDEDSNYDEYDDDSYYEDK